MSPTKIVSADSASPLEEVWVAIDVETTGLDPGQDKIIEVAAVKFQGNDTIDRFQSFVNPNTTLSPFIRRFTGISQAEVDHAPEFQVVGSDLALFIGPAPLVGHNIRFDLNFLESHGLAFKNARADTLELAHILMPEIKEYGLKKLAEALKVSQPRPHRALDDAGATKDIFLQLLERAMDMDESTLKELNRLASFSSQWPASYVLRKLVQTKVGSRAKPSLDAPTVDLQELATIRRQETQDSPQSATQDYDLSLLRNRLKTQSPLRANQKRKNIDSRLVEDLLQKNGPLSDQMEGFEQRNEQVEMALAVTKTLNENGRLIVEAGTGVGKSLAYLLPAALYAAKNNKRVVVSTNTINLQEQLMSKDIPTVVDALGDTEGFRKEEFKYTLLKGRSNYLCLKRWSLMQSASDLSEEEVKLVAKIFVWLSKTCNGDRSEITLGRRGPEAVWGRLSAQGASDCTGLNSACFLRTARGRALEAHLVVVNHALLMTDLVAGGTLIPEHDVLIIDEAHHLEEEATKQLGFQVSQTSVNEDLQTLGNLVNTIASVVGRSLAVETRKQTVQETGDKIVTLLPSVRERLGGFFGTVSTFLYEREEVDRTVRVSAAVRESARWPDFALHTENLTSILADLLNTISDLNIALQDLEHAEIHNYEGLLMELNSSVKTINTTKEHVLEFGNNPKEDGIYWLDRNQRSADISLHSAPLHVGSHLMTHLYERKECTILTSATVSANSTFNHIRERVGLDDADELLLGSPFDYPTSALLCVPTDIPEPTVWEYRHETQKAIIDAAVAASGRTMVLFTSYTSLNETARAIRGSLQSHDLDLLAQGTDGTPHQILGRFLENPRSVILGTSSFWEGVDIAGDSLLVLVVMRLPFSVPSDPIFEARSELYENPFNEYAVPQAVLRLRQGFGRLIRTKLDRGVVVILDKRIVARRYGRRFIDSLPPASRKKVLTNDIGATIGDWLNK